MDVDFAALVQAAFRSGRNRTLRTTGRAQPTSMAIHSHKDSEPYNLAIGSTGVLKVLVEDCDLNPSLRALCAGYESGRWRSNELVRSLFDWLPDFALTHSERESLSSTTAVQQLRVAAHSVYATDKYKRRGEFGEILLHAVLREVFQTEPAISKLYYKDSTNDTVKGFDAIHVARGDDGDIELWLGEVKFYKKLSSALTDIAAEIVEHLEHGYLRSEFGAVVNKLDDSWHGAADLRRLLHPNTSLDEVTPRIRIPALVTYDSKAAKSHSSQSDEYKEQLELEVRSAWESFNEKNLPGEVVIHLLLVPLIDKAALLDALHERLVLWQTVL